MKVNFVIAGAQKAGTSALYSYLQEHPQIQMEDQKEVHFFDNEKYFAQSQPSDYTVYHSAYRQAKKTDNQPQLYGDATPVYLYWSQAMHRIHAYNPEMKVIVLLRNPIERAYSHWNMEISRPRDRQRECLSFWDALHNENQRCRQTLPLKHRVYSYLDRGLYCEQIRNLWSIFHGNKL